MKTPKAKQWQSHLANTVKTLTDEDKERIIKTLSRIKRIKYLEYLIQVFQPSEQVANKIRSYYSLPKRPQ